jgi:hypothetical protein
MSVCRQFGRSEPPPDPGRSVPGLPLVITVATPRTPRTPPYRVLTGKFVAALQPVVVVAETAPLLRGVELVPPTGARITSFRMPDALFVAYPRS